MTGYWAQIGAEKDVKGLGISRGEKYAINMKVLNSQKLRSLPSHIDYTW